MAAKVCRSALFELTSIVVFTCPVVQELRPLELLDAGQIKRIRGVAYITRASPTIGSRMVDVAKGLLLNYVSDVFIYIDNYRGLYFVDHRANNAGSEAGASPGYGLTLVAETTTGCNISCELMGDKGQLPEDVAKQCVQTLFNEILRVCSFSFLFQHSLGWMCRYFYSTILCRAYGNGPRKRLKAPCRKAFQLHV